GAEPHGVGFPLVALERSKFLAVPHIPDFDCVLLPSGRQPPAIRAKAQAQPRTSDPRAKREARSSLLFEALLVQPLCVPEFYFPVAARRSQMLAVAAEDDSADLPFVDTEPADLQAGRSIPYSHGAINLSGDQVTAVGTERQRVIWQGDFAHCTRQRGVDFPLRPQVPDPNGIDAGGGDPLAIGMRGHTEDSTPDAANLFVATELGADLARLRVPDLHEPVLTGRNNARAIRAVPAKRHAADFIEVLAEGQGFLAAFVPPERGRIPNANGPISAGRRKAMAVWAEHHARAPFGVSLQTEHLASGRRVPGAHGLVFAARRNEPVVWAVGDAFDVTGMQVKDAAEPAGGRIQQCHGPTQARRGEPFAVRAECQRADGVFGCVDGAKQFSCFRVPQLHAFPEAAARQAPVFAKCNGDRMEAAPVQALK